MKKKQKLRRRAKPRGVTPFQVMVAISDASAATRAHVWDHMILPTNRVVEELRQIIPALKDQIAKLEEERISAKVRITTLEREYFELKQIVVREMTKRTWPMPRPNLTESGARAVVPN